MSRQRHRDKHKHDQDMAERRARLDELFLKHTGVHWTQVLRDEQLASPLPSRRPPVPRPPRATPEARENRTPAKAKAQDDRTRTRSKPEAKSLKREDVSGVARTRGVKRRAKRVTESEFKKMLEIAGQGNSPHSDQAVLLLSYDAGLRACEIADLRVETFLTASGKVTETLDVMPGTAKYGHGRPLVMTSRLRAALKKLHVQHPEAEYVAFSYRWGHIKYRNSKALRSAYKKISVKAGLSEVSSHSGRRTFGTEHAQLANLAGGSIRDVQAMLGHAYLSSTEAYLDPTDAQKEMVKLRARRKYKK